MNKNSITLFLGAGASVCESFPTVMDFFERVEFPAGADARGFQTACQELARRIAVAERTHENTQWPRFDAEKLWGNLELLVNSNKLTSVQFGLPVTHTSLSPQNAAIAPEDLLVFLKNQIMRIYGRSVSIPSQPCPHRDLFALLHEITPTDEPICVYTTNYDTIVEDFFQSPSFSEETFHSPARVCTGFGQGNPGRWNPELFDAKPAAGTRQVNLFKLHGSVTWKWESSGSVFVPVETNWRQATGDTDCLLYFGYKSVPETEPFRSCTIVSKAVFVGRPTCSRWVPVCGPLYTRDVRLRSSSESKVEDRLLSKAFPLAKLRLSRTHARISAASSCYRERTTYQSHRQRWILEALRTALSTD